jgi:hypothetical protein
MRARFKTFAEFMEAIKISGKTTDGASGMLISCRNHVLCESKYRLWNSEMTKRAFLIKLYIREVLQKKNLSRNIVRIKGYELLGRRCFYNDFIAVICGWQNVVNTETGEVSVMLTLVNANHINPFKVLINQVQL